MTFTVRRRVGRPRAVLLVTLALLALGAPATRAMDPAQALPRPCSKADTGGGEWPSYGHDLANTRTQDKEQLLTPAVAATLQPKWVFDATPLSDGPRTSFNNTPVVAGGCVFAATGNGANEGVVFALNAATGAVIWKAKLPVSLPTVMSERVGPEIVGSVSVVGQKVLVMVNEIADGRPGQGPYAAALDRTTGALLWRSPPIDTFPGTYTNASPAVFKNLLFFGFSTDEGDSQGQGGFALIDVGTGAIVKRTYTVPPEDQAKGYAGGGLWATPAIDERTKYAYIGSGNPFSKTIEHPHTNAILKIDMDVSRPTFGEIVDSYKGNIDQYVPPLDVLTQTPQCAATEPVFDGFPLDSPACGQLDLDFGASPNLFVDAQGRTLIGELQKSGVYHTAVTDDMSGAWTQIMGVSCALCNAASTAYDGAAVYGEGNPIGAMWSLDKNSGQRRWVSAIADQVHYQSTSTAAGVVYTTDEHGFLVLLDAATGRDILRRPMILDTGSTNTGISSAGVAIAGHSVFVAVADQQSKGFVVAYRPPSL